MAQFKSTIANNTTSTNSQYKATISLPTLLYCAFITMILIIGVPPVGIFIIALLLGTGLGVLAVLTYLIFPVFIAFFVFLIMRPIIHSIREREVENAGKVTYFNLLLIIDILFILWCLSQSLSLTYIFTSWHLLACLILLIGLNMLSYYFSFLLFNRWKKYFRVYLIIIIIILGSLTIYAFNYHQKQNKQQLYNKFNSWNYQIYVPPNYKNIIKKVGVYPNEHTLDFSLKQPEGNTNDIWETRAVSQIPEKNCYLASTNIAGTYYGTCVFLTVSQGTAIYKFNNQQGYFEVKGNTLIYGYSTEALKFAAFLASFQPVTNYQIFSQYSIQNYEP